MKIDINLELEKECDCKLPSYKYNYEIGPKCKYCNNYRMILTPLGEKIIQLLRDHTKIHFNDGNE
jgi:hypothetical protein